METSSAARADPKPWISNAISSTRLAAPSATANRALFMRPPTAVNESRPDESDSAGHQRGAQDQHDCESELPVNGAPKRSQSRGIDRGRRALPQGRPPRQELAGGVDRQEADGREQRQLRDERNAVEIVRGALLEIEHAQQPHDQDDAGGSSED